MDYTRVDGDSTNFISQCLYAGSGIMNTTPHSGWFYKNSINKSSSWVDTSSFYHFLISNNKSGVFAREGTIGDMQVGDVIQLGNYKNIFYQTLIISSTTGKASYESISVPTHTKDVYNKPLLSFKFEKIRFLHIIGVLT